MQKMRLFAKNGLSLLYRFSLSRNVSDSYRGSLTPDEQLGYIDAVWCLRGLPSRLPTEQYPGVQDRVDDFVA